MEQETFNLSDSERQNQWIEIQDELKRRMVTEDDFDFTWELPSSSPCSSSSKEIMMNGGVERKEVLKYVGGVDISFLKEDPSVACGTLVVMELESFSVVYDDFSVTKLHVPYVPGFLAFREAPILLKLLEKMKKDAHPFYPQLLMVDGNGLLHPRGFGLACHLGVLADIPTIGVGKILHHVDGLNHSEVRERMEACGSKETIYLEGKSGHTLGVAIRSTIHAMKPIFISIGHRISLTTATAIVKMACKYRIPEPIRQADIRSREHLRKYPPVRPSCQS